jgi:hypothetical protein
MMAGVRLDFQAYTQACRENMFEYRPLGATELTFTRWNKQGVGRFYWVMGLDGPDIDSQLLNDALRITVKRIPGLRSRLKRG